MIGTRLPTENTLTALTVKPTSAVMMVVGLDMVCVSIFGALL